jgi:hypothetical protein
VTVWDVTTLAGDWFDGNGNGNAVDVAACLEGANAKGVSHLVQAGALVSLGTTSDGGALGMTVTVNGRWRREYFRDAAEMQAWIGEGSTGRSESLRRSPAAATALPGVVGRHREAGEVTGARWAAYGPPDVSQGLRAA